MNTNLKSRKTLKSEAKELVQSKTEKAVSISLMSIIITQLIYIPLWLVTPQVMSRPKNHIFLYSLIAIVLILVLTVVAAGITYIYLNWIRTKDSSFDIIEGLFSGYSKKLFPGTLYITLLHFLFMFLWSFLFIGIALIITFVLSKNSHNFFIILIFTIIIAFIFISIKGFSYSQAFYIYKDEAEKNGQENVDYLGCITKSRQMMHGNKWRFFILNLSFLGWFILSIFTLFILLLWINPYVLATQANFYDNLNNFYSKR